MFSFLETPEPKLDPARDYFDLDQAREKLFAKTRNSVNVVSPVTPAIS